jgi:hypothetical protein
VLLARIYEVFPLVCPRSGSEMRTIAFITDACAVREILSLRRNADHQRGYHAARPARGR